MEEIQIILKHCDLICSRSAKYKPKLSCSSVFMSVMKMSGRHDAVGWTEYWEDVIKVKKKRERWRDLHDILLKYSSGSRPFSVTHSVTVCLMNSGTDSPTPNTYVRVNLNSISTKFYQTITSLSKLYIYLGSIFNYLTLVRFWYLFCPVRSCSQILKRRVPFVNKQHVLTPKRLNRSIVSVLPKDTYCLSKRRQEQSQKRKVLGLGEQQNYLQEKILGVKFARLGLDLLNYFYNLRSST